jgi:hypothetical protein
MADMTFFQGFSKHSKAMGGLLLILLPVLGSCATATIDNGVPTSTQPLAQDAMASPAAPVAKPIPPRTGAPLNTGAYPNINIVPEGVTSQLSDAESANLRNTLYAEKDAQRMPGEPVEAYIARLRKLQKLGSTHAAAALAQIEASQ